MVSNKAELKECPCCMTPNPASGSAAVNNSAPAASNGFKPTTFSKPAVSSKKLIVIYALYIIMNFSYIWIQTP